MASQKNSVITIGVIAAILVIAFVAAEFLYFRPAEALDQDAQAEKLQITGSQKQFKEIEEKLLANEKFQSLEKMGQWPLDPEKIIKGGKTNPFIPEIKK